MDRHKLAEHLAALRSRIIGPPQRSGESLSADQVLAMRRRGVHSQRTGESISNERLTALRFAPSGDLDPELATGSVTDSSLALLEQLQGALEELQVAEDQLRLRNQDLAAANRIVEAERQRYRDLFEWAPDGYLVTDAAGVVLEANQAGASMLGTTPEALAGQSLASFVPAHQAEDFRARLSHLPATAQSSWELRLHVGQRPTIHVTVTAAPMRRGESTPTAFRWLLHDITERARTDARIQRLNEELERRVADLGAVNRELESFSYSVSHDLRAPLRAVEGFASLLSADHADALSEEGQRLLRGIRSSAVRMSTLIDDLLGFSRLGRQGINVSEVDMTALAQSAFEEVCTSAAVPIPRFDLDPLPRANADRSMMRQVFLNLLSNAAKFSVGRDAPSVAVTGWNEAQENIYQVSDNGVGFDMRYAGRLFGVFQRLHSTNQFEGSGVGLAIVQRIVQRHGGRTWAEGKLHEGATFYFSLPSDGPPEISLTSQ